MYESTSGACDGEDTTPPPVPEIGIQDKIISFTYKCDTTSTGPIPIFYIDTKVSPNTLANFTVTGSDGIAKSLDYRKIPYSASSDGLWISENITLKAGETFRGTTSFDQDISMWEPGILAPKGLEKLNYTFTDAVKFNSDISKWDVSNVTSMNETFSGASVFNQDISGWKTGNVTDMKSIFNKATLFNQNLTSWDVSKVTAKTRIGWNSESGLESKNYPKFT